MIRNGKYYDQCVRARVCACECTCVCVYVCACVHVCMHMCVQVYIHVCKCVCMCVRMCVCAYNTCSTVVVLFLNSTLESNFGDLFTCSGTISITAPQDSAKKICGIEDERYKTRRARTITSGALTVNT